MSRRVVSFNGGFVIPAAARRNCTNTVEGGGVIESTGFENDALNTDAGMDQKLGRKERRYRRTTGGREVGRCGESCFLLTGEGSGKRQRLGSSRENLSIV